MCTLRTCSKQYYPLSRHRSSISARRYNSTRQPQVVPRPTAVAIDRWKHPRHGGQNLSERYNRLAKSLRQKETLSDFIDELPGDTNLSVHSLQSRPGRETVQTFRGFIIPEEPKPPAADDCCMSGCAICVYDLYEESLQAYRASVSSLRSALLAQNIPEREWPSSIRPAQDSKLEQSKNVTLSAFEELERMLRERKEAG